MTSQQKLVTLRSCSWVWEAEILCDRLQAAGFTAFVQGAETGRSLSYAGVALGGIRVQVPADELEDAKRLLEEDQYELHRNKPWVCSRCGEPNEASFDFCYSCSLPRSASQAAESDNEPAAAGPSNQAEGYTFTSSEDRRYRGLDASNPYETPVAVVDEGGKDRRGVDTDLEPASSSDINDQAIAYALEKLRWATTCGIVGTIFALPPLHMIGLIVGLQAWPHRHRDPRIGRRLSWLLPSLVVLAVVGTILWLRVLK